MGSHGLQQRLVGNARGRADARRADAEGDGSPSWADSRRRHRLRPRLKDQLFEPYAAGGEIRIYRDPGVYFTIADPDGQVARLIALADGGRTVREIADAMAAQWPSLGFTDVEEGLTTLDQFDLLEDAAAETTLDEPDQDRFFSNIAFFSTYATLSHSRFAFQEELRRKSVLLLGVGGLGSTLLYNLLGLGVGRIVIVDKDRVERRNFARQFLYAETDVGMPKVARAIARAQAFSSRSRIVGHDMSIGGPDDVLHVLDGADLVLSAIDQPANVQDWVNEACISASVPYVVGGMHFGRGLYYSVQPGVTGCRTCWKTSSDRAYGTSPLVRAPRVNRGIGPVASMMGALVSLEALRYLTAFAPPISSGRAWLIDFANGEAGVAHEWPRIPECVVCGARSAQRSKLAEAAAS